MRGSRRLVISRSARSRALLPASYNGVTSREIQQIASIINARCCTAGSNSMQDCLNNGNLAGMHTYGHSCFTAVKLLRGLVQLVCDGSCRFRSLCILRAWRESKGGDASGGDRTAAWPRGKLAAAAATAAVVAASAGADPDEHRIGPKLSAGFQDRRKTMS